MTSKEAIKERHSVRSYKDLPIADDLRNEVEKTAGYYGQKIVLARGKTAELKE